MLHWAPHIMHKHLKSRTACMHTHIPRQCNTHTYPSTSMSRTAHTHTNVQHSTSHHPCHFWLLCTHTHSHTHLPEGVE